MQNKTCTKAKCLDMDWLKAFKHLSYIVLTRFAFYTVPVIALCMGDKGVPSRLLASKFGSHLAFGCLASGRGTAAGQFSMQELQKFRLDKQTNSTQVLCWLFETMQSLAAVSLSMHLW